MSAQQNHSDDDHIELVDLKREEVRSLFVIGLIALLVTIYIINSLQLLQNIVQLKGSG